MCNDVCGIVRVLGGTLNVCVGRTITYIFFSVYGERLGRVRVFGKHLSSIVCADYCRAYTAMGYRIDANTHHRYSRISILNDDRERRTRVAIRVPEEKEKGTEVIANISTAILAMLLVGYAVCENMCENMLCFGCIHKA